MRPIPASALRSDKQCPHIYSLEEDRLSRSTPAGIAPTSFNHLIIIRDTSLNETFRRVHQLMMKMLRRAFRRPEKLAPLPAEHIDAPCMRAIEARIPVGDTVTITPSFQSTRENEPIEEERLGNVMVTGRYGRIYRREYWLMQFSWYGGQTFLPPSYQIPPKPADNATRTEHIEGACTSTISPFDGVYGHALLDELPFLLWLMEAKRYEKYDAILCTKLALRLLERTRHTEIEQLLKRARPARSDTRYEIADFTAIRRSGCRMNPSMEEMQLLRSQLPNRPASKSANMPTRIYLARASSLRTVENEDEIRQILKTYGVEVVSPAKSQNPWEAFRSSRHRDRCCWIGPCRLGFHEIRRGAF